MALTPMMQQYMEVKSRYSDCILFYRLGDFYEMFFEDAKTASRELEITLTGKDCGLEERAPMCGVPYHAVDAYLSRLIAKGYKVAICEQTENPAEAKGLVKRDVVRVVTPGTVIEPNMLDDRSNAYLMCIYKENHMYGITAADVSTGALFVASIMWGGADAMLIDEIARYMPREIVANEGLFSDKGFEGRFKARFDIYTSFPGDEYFNRAVAEGAIRKHFPEYGALCELGDVSPTPKHSAIGELSNMSPTPKHSAMGDLDEMSLISCGALLKYLDNTQMRGLDHLTGITRYSIDGYMIIDSSSRRNLEISETIRDRSRKGSLIHCIDRTMTSGGGRMLKMWIEQPLLNISDIQARHLAVLELKNSYLARSMIREKLKSVYDIERLISRIVLGNCNCRDLLSLRTSFSMIPGIKERLAVLESELAQGINSQIDELSDLCALIYSSISEDAPVTLREGRMIKEGYNPDVDQLRSVSRDGKSWIAALEASEKELTGIRNLKIGYNKVFGYFFEVTKSNMHLAPDRYVRKQTLANCERYITEELKKLEDDILGAEDKLMALENKLFVEIRDRVAAEVKRVKATAEALSMLDVLAAFAETAEREGYAMPRMNRDGVINIKDGRHPVVEKFLGRERFVPNDADIDLEDNRTSIITGPNMAGKSTYMRQVALIVLLAQAGCFVPASEANIGICDRIFTRVGAADDLAAGQSTFMVEMSEVAGIISNATKDSLIVLDEIGRGTSTFDGLSIAWAVVEFITDKDRIGARTLFSTHYHELTELEGKMPGIKNYCVLAEEKGDDIIFLHKIKRGGADGSYGIHVARLAGVPEGVNSRAKEILRELEAADISKKASRARRSVKPVDGQIDFLSMTDAPKQERAVIDMIKGADITRITPIDAMNFLYELKQKLKLG